MRRMIAVAGIAALVPVLVLSCAKASRTSLIRSRPFQDEPPIKVRSGSMHVETLRASAWDAGFFDWFHWKQSVETLSGDGKTLFGLVVKSTTSSTCAVEGDKIYIYLGTASDPKDFKATLTRDKKRVTLKPKGGFARDGTHAYATRETASTADYITLVEGSKSGSCPLGQGELKLMCVDSTLPTVTACQDDRIAPGPRRP